MMNNLWNSFFLTKYTRTCSNKLETFLKFFTNKQNEKLSKFHSFMNDNQGSFYKNFQYHKQQQQQQHDYHHHHQNEKKLVEFVKKNVKDGTDIGLVLDCIDRYCDCASSPWFMHLGSRKRDVFQKLIHHANKIETVLELGTYFGYSALCILNALNVMSQKKQVHIWSIDVDERRLEIANELFEFCNVSQYVSTIIGPLTSELIQDHFSGQEKSIDFIFLDHAKKRYVKDLSLMFHHQILNPSECHIVADNVMKHSIKDYEKYLEQLSCTIKQVKTDIHVFNVLDRHGNYVNDSLHHSMITME